MAKGLKVQLAGILRWEVALIILHFVNFKIPKTMELRFQSLNDDIVKSFF